MSARQELAVLGLCLGAALRAESLDEKTRQAMQASVSKQAQAVAAMQVSIARQRAALAAHAPPAAPPAAPDGFFTLAWPARNAACDPLPEAELAPLITQAAAKEGVDAQLVRAVAEQESGFRPCAVSDKGALGLMQLMPATAAQLGVKDPFDPQESLVSGAHLLKQLLDRFGGDAALALGAYNAGLERVAQSGRVPDIPETTHYVQQILSKLPLP